MPKNKTNLIWIDLEMTGLDPLLDHILEIATVITDKELNILAHGPNLVVHQPDEVLAEMNNWVSTTHGKSGLTDLVKESSLSVAEAERQTLDFIKQYVDPGLSPMCGNSICQDRRFMANYMPKLEQYFHYRHLDVSSIKILAQNWYPNLEIPKKEDSKHRALDDTLDSIQELAFYRKTVFQSPE